MRRSKKDPLSLHRKYAGKIEILPKVPLKTIDDFSVWYTPGVADVSLEIDKNRELSFEYTSRWNIIAVVSDGTRVLGLGKLAPEAAYPVLEGKALLFKYLGGVDAVPLVHTKRGTEEFIELVKSLEPSFGGVNLEDIESPKCFMILDKLRESMRIPVWHDDQQGTAAATLAGLINSFTLVGKELREARIVLLGAGAANIALYRLLRKYGVPSGNIVVLDSKGVLHPDRSDIDRMLFSNPYKYRIAIETGGGGLRPGASLDEALRGADALVAASRPGPGVVKPRQISLMAKDPIVFALANPVPEIWPEEAARAGARIVATGRSDLPNQVNNSLVFPGVFRGALDVRAKSITDSMIIAAAEELALYAREQGLREDRILPTIDDWKVHPRVAAAVASKAVSEGIARKPLTFREELERATRIIARTHKMLEAIAPYEEIAVE